MEAQLCTLDERINYLGWRERLRKIWSMSIIARGCHGCRPNWPFINQTVSNFVHRVAQPVWSACTSNSTIGHDQWNLASSSAASLRTATKRRGLQQLISSSSRHSSDKVNQNLSWRLLVSIIKRYHRTYHALAMPASSESKVISLVVSSDESPKPSERAGFWSDLKDEMIWGWYKIRWKRWISSWKRSWSSVPRRINVYAQSRYYTYQVRSLDAALTPLMLELVQMGSLGPRYRIPRCEDMYVSNWINSSDSTISNRPDYPIRETQWICSQSLLETCGCPLALWDRISPVLHFSIL